MPHCEVVATLGANKTTRLTEIKIKMYLDIEHCDLDA